MPKQVKPTPQHILDKYPKPDNETKEEEKKRLARIKSAKYRYYQNLEKSFSQAEVLSATGPSSRTRSQTSPIATRTRSNQQEAARLRQQKRRASMSIEQIEEQRRKNRERMKRNYEEKKKEQYEEFFKIGHCSLDNYQEERVEGWNIEDGKHKLGKMNIICEHCYALKWKEEAKSLCCLNGQVQLASLAPSPQKLFKFLTTNDPKSNEPFVNKIRAYNQVLAFSSIGTNLDKDLADAREGNYTYRIQGQHYHQIGSLMPSDESQPPKFAQIYFYDSNIDNQIRRRNEIMEDTLDEEIL